MYDINQLSALKKHWLLRTSNIPRRFLGLEPQDIIDRAGEFPSEVSTWIDDAVGGHVIKQVGSIGINGVGLLFDGGPGIGKTTHAVVAAMEFVRRLPSDDAEAAKILGLSISDYGLSAILHKKEELGSRCQIVECESVLDFATNFKEKASVIAPTSFANRISHFTHGNCSIG